MELSKTDFFASINAFYVMAALVAVAFAIVYYTSKQSNKKPSKR